MREKGRWCFSSGFKMWVLAKQQYKCVCADWFAWFLLKSSPHIPSCFEVVMWKWLSGSESFSQIVTKSEAEALFSPWCFFHVSSNYFKKLAVFCFLFFMMLSVCIWLRLAKLLDTTAVTKGWKIRQRIFCYKMISPVIIPCTKDYSKWIIRCTRTKES